VETLFIGGGTPTYLPPEKYFAAHTDWYSEIDGKRKHDNAQLCLTSEDMTRELIKNVLDALRKNPDAKMIDVSQNDWAGFCTCAKCKAIDDAEESHAGNARVDAQQVAEAVEKEFPTSWSNRWRISIPQAAQEHQVARQRLDSSMHD
jgi:hypothetical protein